ncbi:DEAD/DEAH box helicase [Ichthyenterobacterium magnum]|uniref:RAD3-like DEAD/DEAH box helicase n=1 Tax=Ichthyenterobacterium magnum TaxID=1230530 RepID=A0A420DKJ0_9FLAO|nr:DEAD/DEAH box helicase [Ichthyenterobacterium magnum]RKE94770.1 RAD3-like DEAD/DEAH box helicase [Ichthyenterobacterium magnum]
MSFKKLIEPLNDALKRKGFETPLAFQKQALSKIKGGANLFGIAQTGSGKTTTLVISVIQKLKGIAFGDSPRALIIVKDKQSALDLENEFKTFTNQTDLRVYCAYEERTIDAQRDEIYVGVDIVIATPKRLNKLFFLNGIHVSEMQLCIVEDAEFLFKGNGFSEVSRIAESIGKCQYVVFSTTFDSRFKKWQDTFMYNSQIIKTN